MQRRKWWVWLLLGLLTAAIVLWLSGSVAAREETEKTLLEPWQHRGIMAAMTDPDPLVWQEALDKLAEFDLTALTNQTEIPEAVYRQIVEILNNESYPPEARQAAANTLGAVGEAAADQAPKLFELFVNPDEDNSVRSQAAHALGAMGEAAADQIPKLGDLVANPDEDNSVRSQAASALGAMGEAAADQAPKLFELITNPDEDAYTRFRAASALGAMGEAAADQIPKLFELFVNPDEDNSVRSDAAHALGAMGEAAADQASKLGDLVANPDEDNSVRSQAASALGAMGEAAADQAPKLGDLVANSDENDFVRLQAAGALGAMGEAAADQAPKLFELVANSDENDFVRSQAADALGAMGEAAADQAPKLFELVVNPDEDRSVRSDAAQALRAMEEAAADQVSKLVGLVANPDEDDFARFQAASALGAMGEATADQVSNLGELMVDDDEKEYLRYQIARSLSDAGKVASPLTSNFNKLLAEQWSRGPEEISVIAANALSQFGPSSNATQLHLLNAVSLNTFEADFFRFIAYYLSDNDKDAITLIQWLGVRDEEYLPDVAELSHKEAKYILQVFADAWPNNIDGLRKLRAEWPRHIANIVEATNWNTDDLPLLRRHYQNLKAIRSTQAAAVATEIATLEWWRGILIGRNVWLGHAIFWLLLVFVYPVSPQIQAIFFWNPWMRRILGAGYVGFALTWIPFLRARLFAPFQDSLLANAGLAGFTPAAYFPNSAVENKATGHQQLLQEAIPVIKGQVILEGESGLGKTIFLRHIIQKTLQRQTGRSRFKLLKDLVHPPRTMVFLPADRCAEGVSEAIQVKLHGLTKDPRFLRDLIYSGAIDICIDGLNEVTADTRAKITEFVERYFKGNIIMTTQPLEWRPPATATTYQLQPLERDKIQAFLISREPTLPNDAPIQGENYVSACQEALKDALTPAQPVEELSAARRILSNPMDLSIVAQMIANKEPPDLFQLQRQQYKLMSMDYQKLHLREFPLLSFSQRVYEIRLNDQTDIPEHEFFDELQCMERHKMVTCRQGLDNEGQPTKEWNFRHDKVMEFFIVQTFLGRDNDRPQLHMSDPRFRGVYFLLAKLMPIADALVLREELINYAADTRDHTVSDDFVQLLRSRKVAEAA